MKLYAVGKTEYVEDYLGVDEIATVSDWQQLYETPEEALEAVEGQYCTRKVNIVPIEYSGEYWCVTSKDGYSAYTWDEHYANYLMNARWFNPLKKERGVIG